MSQYPVPYFAPALLPECLARPPSSSISTKYKAPFKPQGSCETSTSNYRWLERYPQVSKCHAYGELLVKELEHEVLGLRSHQVQPRANVLAVRALGNELEGERTAGSSNTVCAGVVGSIKSAVRGTGLVIGAEGAVPLVAVIAVVGALGGVQPAPVRIECDGCRDGRARSGG